MRLAGERIVLVPLERRHLEATRRWVNDPVIAARVHRVLPVSEWEHERWFERLSADATKVFWAIEEAAGGAHIGNAGLMGIDPRTRKGELWIYIGAPDRWGKGVGREAVRLMVDFAFDSLNLNKVYLTVGAENERAVRAYRACGFRKDGRLRAEFYVDGSYQDAFAMSILRAEHEARRARGRRAR